MNLSSEVRELKFGSTFTTPNPRTSFHTLKYDFKPASVDLSKSAKLDVTANNQVTVTVPHLDSSGVPKTVFKGNQRNYAKECVLIIDKITGAITMERLHHNIQVKKTRSENVKSVNLPPVRASLENSTQRTVSKTKVSTGVRKSTLTGFIPRNSPLQGSPSQQHHKSPQQAPVWNANNNMSTLPSIPMIVDDDVILPQHHQQPAPSLLLLPPPPPPAPLSSSSSSLSIINGHDNYFNNINAATSVITNGTHNLTLTNHQRSPQTINGIVNGNYINNNNNNHSMFMNPSSGPSTINNIHHNNYNGNNTNDNSELLLNTNGNHLDNNNIVHLQNGNGVGLLSSSDTSSDSSDSDSETDNVKSRKRLSNSTTNGGVLENGLIPPNLLLHEDLRLSESNSSDDDD